MKLIEHPDVSRTFNQYPDTVFSKLQYLRNIILTTASQIEDLDTLEETLKWGEPSYCTKSGSTIRIHWKESSPDQYAMYFHCKTKLVDTFKEIYKDVFKYEGNRAIIFNLDDEIPVDDLMHCIELSLTYHNIKHLPMLGI